MACFCHMALVEKVLRRTTRPPNQRTDNEHQQEERQMLTSKIPPLPPPRPSIPWRTHPQTIPQVLLHPFHPLLPFVSGRGEFACEHRSAVGSRDRSWRCNDRGACPFSPPVDESQVVVVNVNGVGREVRIARHCLEKLLVGYLSSHQPAPATCKNNRREGEGILVQSTLHLEVAVRGESATHHSYDVQKKIRTGVRIRGITTFCPGSMPPLAPNAG